MFDKTARWYDAFYEHGLGKDYVAETAVVADLLPNARSLLDVACGTGLHLQHLRTRFECEGLDLDEGMLAVARERCPDVTLHVGNMIDFDLGHRFDAVICLFSSIGYVRTVDKLDRAISTMARHLAPGGTLLVEPFLQRDGFVEGNIHTLHVDVPGLKATRMSSSAIEDDGAARLEFHYLIGADGEVRHEVETHVLGLFTWDEYRAAFESAGLTTTVDVTGGPMGRGMIVGRS